MVVSFFVFMLGGWGYLSLWHLLGAVSLLASAAGSLVLLPWALWHDRQRASQGRLSHPDRNYHLLPLLNAIGFNDRGTPVLPGTREAKRWLKDHRPLRVMTKEEEDATARA